MRRRVPIAVLTLLALGWMAPSLSPYPEAALSYEGLQSTRIFDRTGNLLYEQRGATGGYARPVELDRVSTFVIEATLAGEDRFFYEHPGVDPTGIARALALNLERGRFAFGGSTLTQQLAKLLDPAPRTLTGKLGEAWDALRLERTLDKNAILAQYLNRAYYGRNAYGIEAAAERFFGKRASDLSLGEAALLAVLPRAPSAYDPSRNEARARRRRAHVLDLMVARGFIDAAEARTAADAPIELIDPRRERKAPHVIDLLTTNDALDEHPAELVLTIDLALQERLERALRAHLGSIEDRNVHQASIAVIDNATGELLAMVGSARYGDRRNAGAVNGTTAARHPGSALKPFVYALALEAGAHPGTPILDAPIPIEGYQPRNAHGRHHGVVSLGEALGSSLNAPAVRLAHTLGTEPLASILRDVGLTTIDPRKSYGPSLALGAAPVRLVELANAYATLARGGRYLPIRMTRARLHHEVPGGSGVYPAPAQRVLDEATAFVLTAMLAGEENRRREFGLETPVDLPFEVAVKTGTSQSFCDNVVVGYTPAVTVAVWQGNFDGVPMHRTLSMQALGPLFRDAMLAAMENRPAVSFARPSSVTEGEVCAFSGGALTRSCPHRRTVPMGIERALALPPCDLHRADTVAHRPRSDALYRFVSPFPSRAGEAQPQPTQVAIVRPADGARIEHDPLMAPGSQGVRLEAKVAPHVERVRFEVDGEHVAEVAYPFVMTVALEPGPHRIRAVALPGGMAELARASSHPSAHAHEIAIDVRGDAS